MLPGCDDKTPDYIIAKANGDAVLNVYYDRVTMTMNFYTWQSGSGYVYNTTTAETGELYGYVDGIGYVRINKAAGADGIHSYSYSPTYNATTGDTSPQFGIIDGEYRELTATPVYTFTRNRYDETSSTDAGTTQYALINGHYVELTRNTRLHYYPASGYSYTETNDSDDDPPKYGFSNGEAIRIYGNWTALGNDWYDHALYHTYSHRYYGTAYTRSSVSASNTEYTGTRYYGGNGNFSASGSGTMYGKNGNTYFPLRSETEVYWTYSGPNGETLEYTAQRYIRYGTKIDYTGQRYERTGGNTVYNYTYTPTDAQTSGLYGVDERGGHFQLTMSSAPAYYIYSYNGNTYTGTRYLAGNQNPVNYTGTLYVKNGPGSFSATTTDGDDRYGVDGNGAYRLLHHNVSYPDIWQYEDPNTHELKTYPSSAQRYTRTASSGRSWQIYKTFTGLYGSSLSTYGYTWPMEYNWYDYGGKIADGGNANSYNGSNIASGGTAGSRMTLKTTFEPLEGELTKAFYGSNSTDSGAHIDFYLQELDGNYTKKDTVYIGGPNGVTTFSINDKYSGFHAAQYKQDVYVSGGRYYIDNNPAWKNVGDKNETTGYYGSSVDFYQELGIRYDRTEYKFTYFTNNASSQIVERPVKFEASLAGYGDQNPGQNTGFYFDGWYADDAFSKRAFFDQASYDASPLTTEEKVLLDKMPDHNETVYGHWLLERSRAVIVPGASDVDIGSQALSFRLDYGEMISGSLLESAKRLGYVLDGWYTDPEFTNRFIFSTPVISGIRGVYSDYQTATRWNAARILYHDDDEAHANVRNIITLYAKWVIDTNARGIKVLYDAGDAAVYDTTGTLTTSIPVDSHLYQRNQNEVAVVAAPPTGYSDKYVFDYWVAVDAGGNQVTMYDNEGNPISQLQTGTVFAVDLTEDAYFEKTTNPNNPADTLLRIIKLKAQYHLSDQANIYTTITYDGNEFTRDRYPSGTVKVHGKTKDGQDQISLTLDIKVNDTVILPGEDDFYLEGYRLVGWSFFEGSYEEQEQQLTAYNNAPGTLPGDRLTSFTPHQKVAADKLDQGAVNTKANTLYAMWLPKYYTVTVKQVIEEGVQANSFDYRYRAGVENAMPNSYLTQNLSGNAQASFTTFTANTAKKLEYYDRVGHVFQIVTPTIAANADYTVRVTAYADLDNGSRVVIDPETVNAKISGTNYSFSSYQIDGDITITYTYVLKVDVKLVKMNLQTNTDLSGSVFTLTPVEWDRNTSSWLKIGDPTVFTLNNTARIKMLEGTYRVDETTVPANFAPLGVQLLLTVKNSEDFTLTLMNGGAVSSRIASLSSTTGTDGDNGGGKKHTLTLFDRPLRTITVNKLVTGTEATPGMTYPFTARVTLEGAALADFNTGADTTNGAGYITFRLAKGESRTITIPWGSVITLAENTLPAGYYLQSVQIPSTVTDTDAEDNVVSFTADADTAVTFTNIRPICRIIDGGEEHVFVTLRDAVSYAETSMGGTATIEMLVDYDMPASDTVTVATSDTITLTTAPKTGYTYNYIGSGDVAAITRGFDGGSLFTVAGALTTESITLDGGNTAFTPLSCNANGGIINSTGSVTVNADTILRNSKAANGGAIYASAGYLNIGEVRILDCYATQDGGAIYLTGYVAAGENGMVIDGHSNDQTEGKTDEQNKADAKASTSNAVNGGGIYVASGASFIFTGGELIKCKASGNGGAIYNAGTIAMTEKTSSQESNQLKRGSLEYCSAANGGAIYNTGAGTVDMTGGYIEHCMATGNGGAVYLANGTTMTMNAGTITGNGATNGAGIYLPEGSTLNISGSPSFGGTAATDGNHIGTGTNAKREDIYIAGYLGTKGGSGTDKDDPKLADSLIVTGKLYESLSPEQAKGQIWVGAQQQDNEDNNHWDTLKQFAKFHNDLMTGSGENMKIDSTKLSDSDVEKIYVAFRNATLTDETYGMTGDGQTGGIQFIYWEGVQGSRKVVLRKVEDSIYESIQGAVFDVYKGNSPSAFVLKDKVKPDETLRNLDSKASGVFWVGTLPYGVYYLHETTVPSGYTGYGTSEGRWFYLVIGDDTVPGSRDGVVMSEGYETRDEAKAAYDSY